MTAPKELNPFEAVGRANKVSTVVNFISFHDERDTLRQQLFKRVRGLEQMGAQQTLRDLTAREAGVRDLSPDSWACVKKILDTALV